MNKKKIKFLILVCIAAIILGWLFVGSGMGIFSGLIVLTFIGEEFEKKEKEDQFFKNSFEKFEEEEINLLEL